MADALLDIKIRGWEEAHWYPRETLATSDIYCLFGGWGEMKFRHIPRPTFDFWFNRYSINKAIRSHTQIDHAFIELSFIVSKSALMSLKHFGVCRLEALHYNLIFSPYIDSRVEFDPGEDLVTADFHFSLQQLKCMADAFPEIIEPLLEKIMKNEPNAVFPVNAYADRNLMQKLGAVINHSCDESALQADPEKLDGLVIELLYDVLANKERLIIPKCSMANVKKLIDIRKLIEYKPELTHCVGDLVKESGLSRTYFDLIFKELSNYSVYNYTVKCKMKKAFQLISQQRGMNISEVGFFLGYKSVQSFSKAFYSWYGFRPSQINMKE